MSFRENDWQQLTFNDSMWGLTEREKRMLDKSWAKPFSEKIFPMIDEKNFSVLYSDKASHPNTPVNVIIGALILKELFGMSVDDILESLMFDIRFQYTLHTTSCDEQPLSNKKKAGNEYRGYVGNVTESVAENNSIITDYQYDKNTHSDSEFLREHLCDTEKRPEQITLAADGAYASEENRQFAETKNITLVTTDLLGKDTKDIYADFTFSEDGQEILLCPAGHQPKSTGLVKSKGKVRASFHKNKCESCPYKDQCNPKISNKTSAVYVSQTSHERAKTQRYTQTWQFKFLGRIRNGVETIPSILRRKYHVDHMPVRGKIRTSHLFGFKIGALNFRKLLKYLDSLDECTLQAVNA